MPKLLETTAEIIAALGGTNAIAQMFDCKTAAVRNWKMTERFPPHTYEMITEELSRLGYSAPKILWKFHRKTTAGQKALSSGKAP